MAPGTRSKFGAPMFEPEVFRKQMYCVKIFVTLLGIFGAPTVIWRPHSDWFGARAIVPLLPPVITPLITARSDAPQQTMILSFNQRLTGTFGLRGGNFQFAWIFAPLWGKRIGKFCRAMILLKQLALIGKLFLNFLNLAQIFVPTSYAYSSNAETLAKYYLSTAWWIE